MVSVVHTELAIQISTFHFQITYDSFPCASIRFYSKISSSFPRRKKSGNFKRSFQTNERLLSSIAPFQGLYRTFQALYRIFRAIQGLYRTFQGQYRSIARGTGTDSFFRVLYRGTLRYSQKKKKYRGTCDPKKKYRVPGTGTKFRSCPSLIKSNR